MSYQQQPQQGGYQYPQAPQPAPPVDREITGVLRGVEQRNSGWQRFLIEEPGKQYPTKVDTKKQEIIQQAMSLMGQQVSVSIREQDSGNPNPHRPGSNYLNRYLNAIAPAGYAPGVMPYQQPQQAPPQQQQQQQPPYSQPNVTGMGAPQPQKMFSDDEKELRIMRETAGKIVAAHWQLLPPEQQSPVGLIEAAETWLAYFVYGPLRFGVRPFDFPAGTPEGPGRVDQGQPGGGSEYHPGYAHVDGQVPADPVVPPQQQPGGPCPDCGFTGQHAIGCPRADYS